MYIKIMECLVKGCVNKDHQGKFEGLLCMPCYQMLTTGELNYGNTFIHKLVKKLTKNKKKK
jgi:hypothetical protein